LLDTDPIYRELNNLKPLGRSLTKEEADNKIAGNDEKLEGLLKKARKSMFESLMIDLNEAVTALLSDFVNASDQSSKSKILNGTYLNSLSDLRGRFIPRVSIFQLLNVGIKESTVPLTEALVDFIRKDTLTSLEGKRFESFHAYWERLMHECYRYRNIKVISLPEYYRAGLSNCVGLEYLTIYHDSNNGFDRRNRRTRDENYKCDKIH
jgi:hypothetical protein